jgi:hypothetical protein
VLATRAHAASPAVDYAVHCQGCHLADGSETPGRVPALAGSVGHFLRVPGGREYLVRVPGSAQSPLSDAALAALLNWMLPHFDAEGLPAKFAPYTGEEVGRLRRAPLTDVDGERRRLLDALRAPTRASNTDVTRAERHERGRSCTNAQLETQRMGCCARTAYEAAMHGAQVMPRAEGRPVRELVRATFGAEDHMVILEIP